jgi:kumamolisin
VAVPGTDVKPLAGARSVGPVTPHERFEVTVRVKRRAPVRPLATQLRTDGPIAQRQYLSREAYAEQHGADPADLERVSEFARAHGLTVVDRCPARRSVFLSGTAEQFAQAFGTEIHEFECPHCSYRSHTGPLTVPASLQDIVEGVFGIDDRPAAKPHFQRLKAAEAAVRARAVQASFTPTQLAQLYDFPADSDGSGQCIALIELGGGYRKADLKAYFEKLGLPVPKVLTVRVDGGRNAPSGPDGADGEVMLDIEVAAAVAPKASIAVYFAPNTDKGFLDAITQALHDTVHKPSVISISWGNPEKNWSAQAMTSFDQAFQTAALLGVTICCAAGDAGSGDENPDGGERPDGCAHADFPGSSPNVLCCGGTRVVTSGTQIQHETVWNDDPLRSATGGGVSDVFDLPAWQAEAGVPASANPGHRRGRGVPDVAGNADPATGYQVRVDGEDAVIGGTSAVAPLWAGLIARLNQRLGKPVGFLNPLLYGAVHRAGGLRDVTEGNNGAYRAQAGWDACTGWGSPVGSRLLDALQRGG